MAVDPGILLTAIIGLAATITAALVTRNGDKTVAKVNAEQAAYTRASEIDAGVVARLEAENDRLTRGWAADREAWAEERAELREEAERLEKRLRELLDEVVALRARHDTQDVPRPR